MSIKLINRAYLYLTIGHEGFGPSGSLVESDKTRLDLFFHTNPPTEAASVILALGTGE